MIQHLSIRIPWKDNGYDGLVCENPCHNNACLAMINDKGILLADVLFKSPSYAAAFVIGGHANGLTEWKNADGKTLKNIENSEVSMQ
jgi:hypothetical protein